MKDRLALVGLLIFVSALAAGTARAASSNVIEISSVDRSDYPEVRLSVAVGSRDPVTDFKVKAGKRPVENLTVKALPSDEPVAVTLLIDVSKSMNGKPLKKAKEAARLFIRKADRRDKISVVAFAGKTNTLTAFTNDRRQLNKAINELSAPQGTAIFDALAESLAAIARQPQKKKMIILLSDGRDQNSERDAKAAASLAKKLGVNIYSIGLRSNQFNPAPLEMISKRSGAKFLSAPSPESLAGLYETLAASLHKRFVLTFTAQDAKPAQRVRVFARVGNELVTASAPLAEAGVPAKLGQDTGTESRRPPVPLPLLAAILAFLSAVAAVAAIALFIRPEQHTLAEQLRYYDQLRGISLEEEDQKQGRLHRSVMGAVGRVSLKYGFTHYAETKLSQAGLPIKPHEYVALHIAAVVLIAGLSTLITQSIPVAVILAGIGTVAPIAVIAFLIHRRRSQFDEQLPDTLNMLAGFMRAGYGIQQAIASAAEETVPPMSQELTRVNNHVQLGMPLEEALEKMLERTGSAAFKWVVVAISIHRETGGNLTEILETLSNTLRQRMVHHRQVKALTAEGRLSAAILIAMPFIEAALLFYINPSYMSILITTSAGRIMLAAALVMMGIGVVWIRKIIKVEL